MFKDIRNLETYDPSEIKDKQLLDDWRIAHAWWGQIAKGREFTYSREQVINVASLIYEEMKKREIEFHPEKYSAASRELFEIISEGKVEAEDQERDLASINRSGEDFGEVIRLEDVLPYFKDFYTSKPFIYLVGGLCNHPKAGTKGDIDILIRAPKPRGNEQVPLMFRLYRMFPKELWHRIQILWSDDDFGPFTNFIPIYNNLMERTEDKEIILMSRDEYADGVGDYPEFRKDSNVRFEDALRSTKEGVKSSAEESKKRGIKPFRFFEMLKGIAGYRKQETYSIEGLKAVLKKPDYPYEVDEKYDGMRVQIHKRGKEVKIFSIDGENLTGRLDEMVSEAKSLKGNLVLDAEVTGWTKGYRKGNHLGRSDVAGYIHSKDPVPENVHLFANIFDVLYFDKDIHTLPLAERRVLLEKLPNTDSLKIIPIRVAKDWDEMKKAVAWASAFPGSEGAMIKSMKSAYPLSGQTAKWIKFKKEADIDAEVVAVHKVKGSDAYNYLCVIRTARGDPVPVGRTYNTNIKAKEGDIIRVAFVNLNEYTDPDSGKVWFNWWSPRVIELREDKNKPDNDLTAREIADNTKGEKGEKAYPKRYKEVLKTDTVNLWLQDLPDVHMDTGLPDLTSDELSELMAYGLGRPAETIASNEVFDADPMLTPADEEKKWRFVLHNHFRGQSLHGDIRFERPSFLVGWTLDYQKEGKPSKDIDTMEEAKAFASRPSNIKDFKQGDKGAQQIVAQKKPPEPLSWIKAEGVFAPGEVGATKEHEGVFDIVAEGEVEFGTQKPYYHEYFLHTEKGPYKDMLQGRFVVRQLQNIWGGKAGRGKFVWMAWLTKDQEPYILSKRAVDIGAMPPQGLSWLPRAMRKRIPKQYRYWTEKDKSKARKMRDELSELYRKNKITLDQTSADIPDSGMFTLTETCWRGPIVIRGGCSRMENHLFLHGKGARAADIIMDGNPIELGKVSAALGEPKDTKWMKHRGSLPNESVLNPDKETPATQRVITAGSFKVVERDGDRITFDFKSKDLSGKWLLARSRPKTSLWVFKKSE